MSLNVGSLLATIDIDKKPFERGFAAWRTQVKAGARGATDDIERESKRQRDALGRFVKQSGDEGEKSGRGWGRGFLKGLGSGDTDAASGLAKGILHSFTSVFEISAKSAATAFSAQFTGSVVAGLASGAAKIAHGVAAIAALLPAAAFAGIAAFTALKLAVSGVGDALSAGLSGDTEKFNEALKKLSPSARGFAREVVGMKGQLDGLKSSVQEHFFSQFAGDTRKLGGTYLPMVRSALAGVAESFGVAAHNAAEMLGTPKIVNQIKLALGASNVAIASFASGLVSIVRGFVPLVAVGSTFLPRLASGFADATDSFARFMTHAADTGKLADFIQGGIDKLRSLWETAKQVGRIIGNVIDVFQQFGAAGGGVMAALGIHTGGLLDQFEQLTQKAKAFFATDQGGQAITQIFAILKSLLSATFGTLAHLVPIVGRAFGPILPQLSKFAEAIVDLQFALADALEPALDGVAGVLKTILPPITSLFGWISDNAVAAGALAGVIVGLVAVFKTMSIIDSIQASMKKMNFSLIGGAAAIGGLVMAAQAMEAANQAKAMDEMAEGLAAIDYAATSASKAAILNAESMGLLDEAFGKAEQSGGDAASKLVDLMEAAGVSEDTVAGYRHEVEQAAAAQDNQTEAIERTADALRAQNDPIFAAMDAQQSLADAQQHLIDLQKDNTTTSADLQAAQVAVAEAAGRQDQAMLSLQQAVQDGDITVGAFRSTLQRWVEQGAITQASADVTYLKFVAIAGAARDVPGSVQTNLRASDHASSKIISVGNRLGELDGRTATVNIKAALIGAALDLPFMPKKHHQGRIGGDEYVALLQRGESVLARNDPLNKALVGAGGDTSKLMASGGMAGHVDITIHGTGLLEGLRKTVRVEGGGSVQVALGG